jgi:hypothetical protein
LKNLAAHNHLSIRTEVIIHFHLFSDTDGIYVETWVAADCFGRGGVSITGECGWWDEMTSLPSQNRPLEGERETILHAKSSERKARREIYQRLTGVGRSGQSCRSHRNSE